eukprot:30125-Hanusia_phi.AAC.1
MRKSGRGGEEERRGEARGGEAKGGEARGGERRDRTGQEQHLFSVERISEPHLTLKTFRRDAIE